MVRKYLPPKTKRLKMDQSIIKRIKRKQDAGIRLTNQDKHDARRLGL